MAEHGDHHLESAMGGIDGRRPAQAATPYRGTVQWPKGRQRWTHVLADRDSMEDLQQPIRATSRIKYVCLTASDHLIAMGTNTGVVYVFNQGTLRYIHMLPGDKEGSVVKVSLSSNGQLLGYAISTGLVLVVKLPADQRSKPDRLKAAGDHRGSAVSAMCWNQQSNRLFIGDDLGKVSVLSFFQAASKAHGLLRPMSEIIMKLDSAVVQIDTFNEKIVVSTRTRTYLCNTTTQQFSQIGKRPRDGQYGACFYHSADTKAAIIYCGRPGSRVWEVDYSGSVLNTHQFKQLLDVASLPLVETRTTDFRYPVNLGEGPGPQSVNFPNLLRIGGQFLLSWTEDTLYILDPVSVCVLLWNNQLTGITDVCCRGEDLYVLKDDSSVVQLQLVRISKLVASTFKQRSWTLCAELAICFGEAISGCDTGKDVTWAMMSELKQNLPDDSRLRSPLDAVISDIRDHEDHDEAAVPASPDLAQSPSYELLDNGIYVINNKYSPLKHRKTLNKLSNNLELANDNSGNQSGEVTDSRKVRKKDAENVTMVTRRGGIENGETYQNGEQLSHVFVTLSSVSDGTSRETSSDRDRMLPWKQATACLDARNENISTLTSTCSIGNNSGFQYTDVVESSSEVTAEHSGEPIRSPRKMKLLAVKERISTRVRTTTKSVIQNLKDRKTKLARKVIHSSAREADSEDEEIVCTSRFPSIDTSALETATRQASDQIQNVRVFYNPAAATEVLNQWLRVLHQTLHCLHLAILEGQPHSRPSMQDKADPQDLSPSGITQDKADPQDLSLGCVTQDKADPDQDISLGGVAQDKTDPQDVSLGGVAQHKSDPQDVSLGGVTQDKDFSPSGAIHDRVWQDESVRGSKPERAGPSGSHSTVTDVIDLEGPTCYQDVSSKDLELNTNTENEHRESLIGNINITELIDGVNRLRADAHKGRFSTTDSLFKQTAHHQLPDGVNYLNSIDKQNVETDNIDSGTSSVCDTHVTTPGQGQVLGSGVFRDVAYLSDPFSLTAEVYSEVSALAQLCWSFRCHGSVSGYLQPDGDAGQDKSAGLSAGSLSSRTTATITDTDSIPTDLRCHVVAGTEVLRPQWYDSRLLDVDNGVSEEDDLQLAVFLRCYFHLFLGAVDKVHETIRISRGSRFHRWRCLVDCLIELGEDDRVTCQIMLQETQTAIDILRSEISPKNSTLTLAHMIRLYGMVPLKTLEFCAEINKYISPLDVLYMTSMGSKVNEHFLFYIKRLLAQNDRTFRAVTLGGACSDPEIRHVLLQCLFNHHPPERTNLCCTCGMPRPGAHCIEWQEATLIDQLLDLPTSGATEKELCCSHGYWSGYFKMCLRHGDKDAHQMAAVQLGDLRLLSRDSQGAAPNSIEEWKKILQWKKQQCGLQAGKVDSDNETSTRGDGLYKMVCLWCGAALTPAKHWPTPRGSRSVHVGSSSSRTPSRMEDESSSSRPSPTCGGQSVEWTPNITWESLGLMLVETVGAQRGLELVRQVAPPEDTMSVGFYRRCVASTVIERKQNRLVRSVLENKNSQLWTIGPEPPGQPPIPHEEAEWTKADLTHSPYVAEVLPVSQEGTIGKAPGGERSVGVSTKGICSGCGLLYGTSVLPLGPGIALFKCGHGFHKSCASSLTCPLCEPSETSADNGSLFKQ